MGRLRKLAAVLAAGAVVASGAVLLDSAPASAQKVANPGGGFVLKVQQGSLAVGGQAFDFDDEGRLPQCSDGENNDDAQDGAVDWPADGQCSSASDDSETASGNQPKQPIQLTGGTVNANGTYTFTNISFPPQYFYAAGVPVVGSITATINIVGQGNVTGTINPITGAMDLSMTVDVQVSGSPLSGGCHVGPITFGGATTGTTSPPGPNLPISGTPYDPATGRVSLVQNSFSVPGASGCSALFVSVNDELNDALGLPSAGGNNEARFTMEFTQSGTDPQPGVVASFTTAPSSGPAPLSVAVNASASTSTNPSRTYAWDWTNDGTLDTGFTSSPTSSHTFPTAGTQTIRLQVKDGDGDIATTTRSITVGPNQPPIASDTSVTVPEDGSGNVTVSATDPEGGAVTYARTTPNPAHGTATCTSAGVCTYTPAANYNGPDTFGFRASDSFSPPNTDDGLVHVTVSPVNDAPTASNTSGAFTEDTAGPINLVGNDIDGDALTYAILTPPTKGVITGSGSSQTYTPNPDANGADTFTYDVSDPSGAHSSPATGSITITPANDAPVATPLDLTTAEDTAVPFTVSGTDIDGDTLTPGVVAAPTHGTLSGTLPNLTYAPAANFNGTDAITIKVTDPTGASDTATVAFTVTPANDGPTASDTSASTIQDNPVTVSIAAADIDGDTLTYTPSDGANGTVSCTGNACTYTPASGFAGSDAFAVTVSDPGGLTATAHVTVNVSALNNHAPVVNDQTVAVLEDTARSFTIPSSDVDGNARSLTILTPPAQGTLTCDTAGACTYTPAPDATADQTAVVQVSDGVGGVDTASITLSIANLNDTPAVPAGQDIVTAEDTPGAISLAATDADGDPLSWAVKVQPTHGSVSCTGAGACTYTPDADRNGADSFDVEVSDGNGGRTRITVPVTVTSVDDAVVAGHVGKTVGEDSGASSFALAGSDPDGTAVTFAAAPATLGSLSCSSAGACTFTPAANANGTEVVAYTVSDGTSTATGSVTLTVTPVNDAPVASGLTLSTTEDTPVGFTLPAADVDGDALGYVLTSTPATGHLSGALPNLTYPPGANASGTESFGFTARDAAGATSSGTVTITTTAVDDLPVATSAAVSTPEDTAKAIALTGTDAEGPVTVTITSLPAHGTYAGGAYAPAANYNGSDLIGFQVKDGGGQTANGAIVITVTPVNDPPVAHDLTVSTTRTVPVATALPATDVDGIGTLTFTVTSGPTKGTLSGTAPNLTYTPTGFNTGSDVFAYKVTDSGGLVDTGTVHITITAGGALPTQQVVAPSVVTKPGGLLGILQSYKYTNLSSTLTTVGTNLPVSGVKITFSVLGKAICSANTNASGVATCSGTGPRKDSPTYAATSTATAAFAASTGTGALS
jgi:hypothetical protein